MSTATQTCAITPVDVLIAARRLIEQPANFIPDELAQDAEGASVWPCDDKATRFCGAGAIYRAAYTLGQEHSMRETTMLSIELGATELLDRAAGEQRGSLAVRRLNIVRLAETEGHAAVLVAYSRAIALAAEQEGMGDQPAVMSNDKHEETTP